jgi:hypothetical protein
MTLKIMGDTLYVYVVPFLLHVGVTTLQKIQHSEHMYARKHRHQVEDNNILLIYGLRDPTMFKKEYPHPGITTPYTDSITATSFQGILVYGIATNNSQKVMYY